MIGTRQKNDFIVLVLLLLPLLLSACNRASNDTAGTDGHMIAVGPDGTENGAGGGGGLEEIEHVEYDVYLGDPIPEQVQETEIEESESVPDLGGRPTPVRYAGGLELPVNGATGFAPVSLLVHATNSQNSSVVAILAPGSVFVVLKEEGEWWYIEEGGGTGWVLHRYCFINLPDVVPSIVYDITNTYASAFVSSGIAIPFVTGQALYQGRSFNGRLGRDEFIAPILYATARRIYVAQQAALAEGNTLVVYEAFRPLFVQQLVSNNLSLLVESNQAVYDGINQAPWHIGWFIADGVSSHQMGWAIDVTLARVNWKEEVTVGNYLVTRITGYTEYSMPTAIHDLSAGAAVFTTPLSYSDRHAWRNAAFTSTMTESAILLHWYMVGAGLFPLASEWWHFNDLDAGYALGGNASQGNFVLGMVHSRTPH